MEEKQIYQADAQYRVAQIQAFHRELAELENAGFLTIILNKPACVTTHNI